MIRLLLAEDHPVVRTGLVELLGAEPDVDVVASVGDGAAAVAAVTEVEPDIALLDVTMPEMDGIEATRRVVAARPETRVVILTASADREQMLRAVDAGALGYLLKDASPEELIEGVRAAARGESPLDPKVARELLADRRETRAPQLTDREREVLALVGEGLANKLIDIFGSMRWHLIEFDHPLLTVSDHPIIGWHMKDDARLPEPNRPGDGALNFLEVRAPISPNLALLMTWQDLPDSEDPIAGTEAIAANINAFTIANAERQWMYQPGCTPPIARGYLPPVAPALVSGYGVDEVEASEVRKTVSENIQPKLGENFGGTAEIVAVRSRE